MTFVTSGLDIDGKTIDFKLNLKPIDINLKQSGAMKILNTLKNFLSIPYFSRKKPITFLQKRIISIMEAIKKPQTQKFAAEKKKDVDQLQGFEKVYLEDIKNEKNQLEKSIFVDQDYKKYDLKDQKKNHVGKSENWLQTGKVVYEEMVNLRAKALKKQKREKVLDLKENFKRLGVFMLVDYKEIEFKLERSLKSSPLVTHFSIPEGKITAAFNQPQTELNFLNLNGIKLEFNKDLDYLFDLLVKII